MPGLRIATSDKFLLWFLRWQNIPRTIRELARDIEAYQASHPDFCAYEGTRLEEGYTLVSDLGMMHQIGWIEIADGESLDRVVTLTPFGELSAALFEPHWKNATISVPNTA